MTRQDDSGEYGSVVAAIRARPVEWDFDPALDRIAALLDVLGQPQRAYPVIHIAGTNGKSSVARMTDALLRERGLRVGRYTSPHLATMRERISVDGEPISEERFAATYRDVEPYLELVDAGQDQRLSFFEVLTAMAYAAFADTPVDVAVVETGMGGTWDATNVADGQVAVITPIAFDHTDYLGTEIEQIAAEKAGIIKPGSVVVMAAQQPAAAEVLLRRIADTGATVAREGLEFGVVNREVALGGQQISVKGLRGGYEDLFLPLHGAHQAANAACAIAAVEAFAAPGEGDVRLDDDLVRNALAGVDSPGRLEVMRRSPTVMVDAAHNPAGMAATAAAVEDAFTFTRLVGVVAAMADKDVVGLLEPLEPLLTELVVTRNSSPRSMPVEELAELAVQVFGAERVHPAPQLDDAIDAAVTLAEETGEFSGTGVLITGSVVTAGDARLLLGGR
ncbi:bifunctional folylpolyglutamate synthase/dihydrofolate synthase [Allonocardiopsis opalescens]|uniref:Dihydrofolate synthase/folylpolyglutamate synthase n=1 Tax=Allonocardiopsis opalescens TaxID=1144618 RepID=A0A2T0PXW4_9ACTN|nr:folylpolyglutamate synthase/dihydrofolate synthase family protein [Allonocardiopsis opalescens]PRX96372.1 dihydrofolate synthase/folylpolyglutamate synthase [Allonocardiopsis opalescens]